MDKYGYDISTKPPFPHDMQFSVIILQFLLIHKTIPSYLDVLQKQNLG
jgi:hypothetical protein